MDADAYVDMLPWVLFVVIDRKTGLGAGWAGVCAALAALALCAWAYWQGRRAPLPRLALVIFGACGIAGLAYAPWGALIVIPRSASVLTLSLVAFASLRRSPISTAYSSANVTSRTRRDPRFAQVNRDITAAWAVAALVVAVSFSAPTLFDASVPWTVFGWALPLGVAGGVALWTSRRWTLFRLATEPAEPAGPADPAEPAGVDGPAPYGRPTLRRIGWAEGERAGGGEVASRSPSLR